MTNLMKPNEVTKWGPAEITFDSGDANWTDMQLCGYRYARSDVVFPPKQDFSIVIYKRGATNMNRRSIGRWETEPVSPGIVSVLYPEVESHWRWNETIEVSHFSLSPRAVKDAAADIYECDIASIEWLDVLRSADPVLTGIATQLETEARYRRIGERAYSDCLSLQASIHLLRHYAEVKLREPALSGHFTPTQKSRICDYVAGTLDRLVTLGELAALVNLSVFHFSRKFSKSFGMPPHVWLIRQRVERVKQLLARADTPLKFIAADAGFSDQSHMTRVFRRVVGATPGKYRDEFQRR